MPAVSGRVTHQPQQNPISFWSDSVVWKPKEIQGYNSKKKTDLKGLTSRSVERVEDDLSVYLHTVIALIKTKLKDHVSY